MHQRALRRAISAYIGVLLMVALSVASGAIFITLSGSLSPPDTSESIVSSQEMILDSSVLTNIELVAYIRNSGKHPLIIDRIYINEILVTEPDFQIEINDPGTSDDEITGGEVGILRIQPQSGFSRGANYHFKIISKNNKIIEFQKKAPLEAPVVLFTDSKNLGISGVDVQYRSGGWKHLGTTDEKGEVLLLLEPRSYKFRLSYRGATLTKTQNIANDPVVEFKTLNVTVKLVKSDGSPISGATAKYSASGWKTIGTTNEKGQVTLELLPKSYNFRITYDGATHQKQQNIEDDPVVQFQTNDVIVKLITSIDDPIMGATVQYYSGTWKTIGVTNEVGEVSVSLLPMSYKFRVSYGGATQQKTQDVEDDPLVLFSTELVTVKFVMSNNDPIIGCEAKYYACGWKTIGVTDTDGEVRIELLPLRYKFRIYHGGTYLQKRQDVFDDPLVEYQTINVTVFAYDAYGPVEGLYVRYQSGGWRDIGYTGTDGMVSVELLGKRYRFRLTYLGGNYYVRQDVTVNPYVVFNLS